MQHWLTFIALFVFAAKCSANYPPPGKPFEVYGPPPAERVDKLLKKIVEIHDEEPKVLPPPPPPPKLEDFKLKLIEPIPIGLDVLKKETSKVLPPPPPPPKLDDFKLKLINPILTGLDIPKTETKKILPPPPPPKLDELKTESVYHNPTPLIHEKEEKIKNLYVAPPPPPPTLDELKLTPKFLGSQLKEVLPPPPPPPTLDVIPTVKKIDTIFDDHIPPPPPPPKLGEIKSNIIDTKDIKIFPYPPSQTKLSPEVIKIRDDETKNLLVPPPPPPVLDNVPIIETKHEEYSTIVEPPPPPPKLTDIKAKIIPFDDKHVKPLSLPPKPPVIEEYKPKKLTVLPPPPPPPVLEKLPLKLPITVESGHIIPIVAPPPKPPVLDDLKDSKVMLPKLLKIVPHVEEKPEEIKSYPYPPPTIVKYSPNKPHKVYGIPE